MRKRDFSVGHSIALPSLHDGAALPALLDVPNPFIAELGRIRLLEPQDAPLQALYERLLDGSYDKPFVLDDGRLRYLHFGLNFIQSAMRIDQPDRLDLRYTRKMMCFLLFCPQPARLTMLGLGGGSLAKFCYRHLPETQISVVELDPDVIALREHFMVPADDARFCIIHDDGLHHVRGAGEPVDVLLVDAFDGRGLAKSVADADFIRAAHEHLDDNGILVMNLAGEKREYADLVTHATDIFDQQVLVVPVADDGNTILFGFKERLFVPDWPALRSRAKTLRRRFDLDFSAFVSKLQRAAAATCEETFSQRRR